MACNHRPVISTEFSTVLSGVYAADMGYYSERSGNEGRHHRSAHGDRDASHRDARDDWRSERGRDDRRGDRDRDRRDRQGATDRSSDWRSDRDRDRHRDNKSSDRGREQHSHVNGYRDTGKGGESERCRQSPHADEQRLRDGDGTDSAAEQSNSVGAKCVL
jgi:hypothetical protein